MAASHVAVYALGEPAQGRVSIYSVTKTIMMHRMGWRMSEHEDRSHLPRALYPRAVRAWQKLLNPNGWIVDYFIVKIIICDHDGTTSGV